MNDLPAPVTLSTIEKYLLDALFIIDSQQKVVWSNDQAALIFGTDRDSTRGLTLSRVTGIKKLSALLQDVLEQGEPLPCSYEGATVTVNRLSRRYFFKIAVNPIYENGNIGGALVQFTDVTRFHEMEGIKNDFVSIVSHEFRTPLTTIIVGVDMLREGMLGDLTPRGKEVLEAIGSDCERLTRLIDNLLELSKIESGAIQVKTEPVDVSYLLEEAVRPLKFQAESKGVELINDLPPEIPPVEADFNKAVWILTNLIGNALRYTDQGGTITVKVRQRGARLFFSVQDNGCGIPKEYQEKIFRKYVQMRKPGLTSGGVGLGLTIARDIVAAHGGEIWVESEEGRGTTFTFTFPISSQEDQLELQTPIDQEVDS